ncbi:MAG: AAA family ATPase [Acetobacteraceae bacterium]|nr:AAA family ATPase [Acetobacteraceae bacterium]
MNAWRDFNDAAALPDEDGTEIPAGGQVAIDGIPTDGQSIHPLVGQVAIDPAAIATFLDVVFGYCDGVIPVRGFVDQGQGFDTRPHNIWIPADATAADRLATYATWAAREGTAVYVIPGTVAEHGQARAEHVLQMQAIVVDLDAGDVAAKLTHLEQHLGPPTLLVESGGRTAEGQAKLHVWWQLNEPAEGEDLARLCALRGAIADKVGGDTHFRSAHQPIRVPGTLYRKHGTQRVVTIRRHAPGHELDLASFADAMAAMPTLPGLPAPSSHPAGERPGIDAVLTTPVHEGGQDAWTRFQGASAAIGHYVRLVHDGRISGDDGWEAICQYNAAMLQPPWPLDRLKAEADRLWALHTDRNGPALERFAAPAMSALPAHTLGALLDDDSPMPDDIIAPRLLTPGGMLVLGGAPKVGKSDFLINLLVHAAAGVPFLCFTPPRPLRVFYLQAEIQYHYLRERLRNLRLDPAVLARARNNLVVTPKLRMLLDQNGLALSIAAIRANFPSEPPDIICIDPIRNLFDGGPDGDGENDNTAMLFFLQRRVEALREAVAPEAGLILCHHTKKLQKRQLVEDPFMALSGASALRSFYTSGMIMFRPDEERPERRLEIELRNGPALDPLLVDKRGGRWVEVSAQGERLVRQSVGQRLDAERVRKHDVILQTLHAQAVAGRLFNALQFAETFENKGGLGGSDTIRDRLSVLGTKGHVKFIKDASAFGLAPPRSKFGYLVIEGMQFGPAQESIDPETGEVTTAIRQVLPSHFKCPKTGACLPVENPSVWVYPDVEEGA